jgi:hypothetical protein
MFFVIVKVLLVFPGARKACQQPGPIFEIGPVVTEYDVRGLFDFTTYQECDPCCQSHRLRMS